MPLETCALNPFAVGNIATDPGASAPPEFLGYWLTTTGDFWLVVDSDELGNQYIVGFWQYTP